MRTKSNSSSFKWYIPLLVVIAFTMQFCKSTQTSTSSMPSDVPVVSYATDILPIMQASCTPCHFPDQGQKKMLDTYTATKESINGIMYRIALPVEDPKFMPFKSKKPPLTEAEITLFKNWVAQNMPE